jgi:hypothetical protein
MLRSRSVVCAVLALAGFYLATCLSGAQAQSTIEEGSTTPGNGSKALLDWLLGKPAGVNTERRSTDVDRIDPDRPHFPEATTAVGFGRTVLESGYTFTKKNGPLVSHSLPEALLRVGMFTNWFEFRIAQNVLDDQQSINGVASNARGPQDLYLGVKVALTEQRGPLPAIALIPQMTVPTGSRAVTAGRVLPGLNVDMSWEFVKDLYGIEVLIANNEVLDDLGAVRHELATGLTNIFQVTENLELFAEWDAFYPNGGLASAGPRHYTVGGLVFFATPNLALDARVGVGLNHRSNDYLTGVGFAARF